MTPVAQLAQNNHRLITLLIVAFICLAVLMIIVTVLATKAIIMSNRRLAERYEALRTETIQTFIAGQKAENAKVIAETRAINRRMTELLDAWPGLVHPDESGVGSGGPSSLPPEGAS